MSIETIILLSAVSTPTVGYGEKQKGAGYNRRGSGVHTAFYDVNDGFDGTITLQGTLELHPGDNDWVDVDQKTFPGDSTLSVTFEGNFVWIRAKYDISSGTINQILYNH